MATTVDTLLVRIESDMADLRRDLKQIEQRTGATGKAFQNLGRIMAAALAGFGVAQVIGTIRTFEDLQATLKAVTGSAELAAASFDLITKFTATTTFQLEEVSGAFITLVNAGIAPTQDALQDIGNIAAARGKDIRDVAQAIFNATTGEMEMLKQLGIVARVDGEKLNVTYKGVTETIDRSADSIVNYIRELSQAEFPTAIEERANTLSGAISNLQDNISLFFMEVGNAGFKQALTDLVKFLIDAVNNAKPLATAIGQGLAMAIRTLGAILEIVTDNLKGLTAAMVAFLAVSAIGRVAALASAFIALTKAIRAAKASGELLDKMMKRSVIGVFAAGLAYLAAEAGYLDEVMDVVAKKFGLSGEEAESAADDIEALNAQIAALGSEAGTNLTPFNKAISKAKEELEKARMEATGMGDLAKVYADLGIKTVDNGLVFPVGAAEQVDELKRIYGELAEEQKKVDMFNTGKGLLEARDDAAELQYQIDSLKMAMQTLGLENDTLANEKLRALQDEFKMLDPVVATTVQAFEQAGQRIADTLADAFMQGQLSMESFKDITRQLIGQIISNFMRLQIINPIINSIMGAMNMPATLPTAGTGAPSAGGGQMHPSMPRLVGERGPELFVPHSAGTLLNNMNTKSAMSAQGVTVNQSLNFAVGVSDTVKAEVMNLMPVINQNAVTAVETARMRGGSLANAFGS